MSSTQITNSTPRIILTGIKDESIRVVPAEPEVLPQHFPLFYGIFPKGDENVNAVDATAFAKMYGDEGLDLAGKYTTHGTPFIKGVLSEGNMVMVQRLRPPAAKTAWLRLSVTIQKGKKTEYVMGEDRRERARVTDTDAVIVRWTTANKNPDSKMWQSLTAEERRIREMQDTFGNGADWQTALKQKTGTDSGSGAGQEVTIPIMDLEVSNFGDYGNNLGIRISAPTTKSRIQPDARFFQSTLARPYRIEMISRKNRRATTQTVPTLDGESFVDLTFKPGVVDAANGSIDKYIGTALLDRYRDLEPAQAVLPTYGPFNAIHVYEDNVAYVLREMYNAEMVEDEKIREASATGTTTDTHGNVVALDFSTNSFDGIRLEKSIYDDATDEETQPWYQMDMLTGCNFYGHPYRAVEVKSLYRAAQEGSTAVDMKETTDLWASEGSDGLNFGDVFTAVRTDDAAEESYYAEAARWAKHKNINDLYNELVSQRLREFEHDACPYLDMARYPFSVFYDTGFPLHIKRDIVTLIRKRKDVSICLSTHEVGAGENPVNGVTPITINSNEVGRIGAISRFCTSYPESEVYNTKCVRANIIMQSGKIINSQYRGYVPMTYEIAMKRARFMGLGDGRMRAGFGYDQDGVKQLRYMKQVSNPFVPEVAREKNWTSGATWAQYYDRHQMFFPAVRTVYSEDTSVLISDINMLIATDLEKVCFRAWRRLVGDTKRTPGQFAELSDRYITEDVEGRYDGRVIIKPRTYYTPADVARGYSWRCEINAYFNNMKTVGLFTVVARRQEELEG